MTDWQPIETIPAGNNLYVEQTKVLLWVADGGDRRREGTAAFGYAYRSASEGNPVHVKAIGFMGNYNITHWAELTTPEGDPT